MPQAATIKSLPRAFRMMKAMQAEGIEWGEDYRGAAAGARRSGCGRRIFFSTCEVCDQDGRLVATGSATYRYRGDA